MFQLRLKGVLSSFKGVSRVFERSLKGVSGKFQWCFRKFQRSFKEVSRLFQEHLKGTLKNDRNGGIWQSAISKFLQKKSSSNQGHLP